jgi:hypothetical protein
VSDQANQRLPPIAGLASGDWAGGSWARTLLGPDRPADLALVVATFVAFVALDRATRTLAVVGETDLHRFSLVAAAGGHRWWLVVASAIVVTTLAVRWPTRLLIGWDQLEEGRTLRLLTGTLVLVLIWQGAAYRYNWLAGRSHWLDRSLVVVFGLAAIARPAFLVAFAAVWRVVAEQFVLPFDTTAGRNIDNLLVLVVLAVAAGHLVHVVTGRNRTAPVLLVAATALASHFFIPGKGKLAIGWLGAGRIADLPLSSYTAGWLAHTNGAWAGDLWGFYDRFRWPIMGATLALELGSILAVTRPRFLRWWLPGCIVFHVVTFATTGFWFLPWIVVEVGLLVILHSPSLRPWVDQNATVARGLVAAAAVVGAPVLFHPPGLAWLDAPVSYGYQIEGQANDGTRYHVPVSALAPLSHHVAFDRLQLGPLVPAAGAYGAVVSTTEIETLESLTTFDQLAAAEAGLGEPSLTGPSQAFLTSFVTYAHQPRGSWLDRVNRWLAPPEHFWTSRPEPIYRFQQSLDRIEVYLVRSIHHDGHPKQDRQLVLTIAVGSDGQPVLSEPAG